MQITNYHLETDLSKIKYFASIRENENMHFRAFLKSRNDRIVDRIVHQIHEEMSPLIDCTLCGNCCGHLRPELHKSDIAILARLENITIKEYIENYCEKNEYGEIFTDKMPCRYLEEKKCRIYENRPIECRSFPNTDKKGFTSRLLGMLSFYEICPIVFNLMERLKNEMRFRR
ncbi:MAG: YkgJ family cysteine cluster protein [Tannerella sp.]|jgi:Fe-S-cluster containining protein|nr:YkgJ family cysteine cluster protein [Tannerella sp.]